MHDCVLIAMAKLGFDLGLPSRDHGYTAPEIAKALLPTHGLTVYENDVTVELPHPADLYVEAKYRKNFRKYLKKVKYDVVVCKTYNVDDLTPWCDCLVEVPRHALAFKGGVYYDGDRVVGPPDQILSLWIPTFLISKQITLDT